MVTHTIITLLFFKENRQGKKKGGGVGGKEKKSHTHSDSIGFPPGSSNLALPLTARLPILSWTWQLVPPVDFQVPRVRGGTIPNADPVGWQLAGG